MADRQEPAELESSAEHRDVRRVGGGQKVEYGEGLEMCVDPSVQNRAIDIRAIDQGLTGQHQSGLGCDTNQEGAEGAGEVVAEPALRRVARRRAENHPTEDAASRGGNLANDLHASTASVAARGGAAKSAVGTGWLAGPLAGRGPERPVMVNGRRAVCSSSPERRRCSRPAQR